MRVEWVQMREHADDPARLACVRQMAVEGGRTVHSNEVIRLTDLHARIASEAMSKRRHRQVHSKDAALK